MKTRVERTIGAQVLSIETGLLAKQAAGSCIVQYGETVVLSASATGPARPGTDFFPLTCDYRERVAAAGKFPGGFLKREGRPTTKETLTARLMDRPIRPQFPEWFHDEVQIQSFVLASDRQNDGDVLAMIGASAALSISPLPFQGPLGSVRLGYINGEFVVFPTHDQLEESDLDLIISGSKDAILMIEGFARELPEAIMSAAVSKAFEYVREICAMQDELVQKLSVVKTEFAPPTPNPAVEQITSKFFDDLKRAKQTEGKHARAEACSALKDKIKAELIPNPEAEGALTDEQFKEAWHKIEEEGYSRLDFGRHACSDGRDCKTLRPITMRGRRLAACKSMVPQFSSVAKTCSRWSPSRSAQAATSNASMDSSTSIRRSSCCTITSRRFPSAKCVPFVAQGDARLATAVWPSAA